MHHLARAANGPCWDQIRDASAAVRAGPGFGYRVLKWKHAGEQVTGPCWLAYPRSTKDGVWYVVNYIHGNYQLAGGREYAFIWIGHLRYWNKTGHCYPYNCQNISV